MIPNVNSIDLIEGIGGKSVDILSNNVTSMIQDATKDIKSKDVTNAFKQFIGSTTISQSGGSFWAKTFGGSNDDGAHSIQQTTDGGYIVYGVTNSFGAGDFDLLIIKLDSSGNVTWAKTFGGINEERSWYQIRNTNDGGYIVSGWTKSFGVGYSDILIIKLNSSGNIQWAKTYGGKSNDNIWDIINTSDGGYILGAETYSFGAGDEDLLIIKLDSSGNTTWAKTYGGTQYEAGSYVYQISDGGCIVSGRTKSFGAGGEDVFILKLNSSGNIQWAKTFGGTSDDGGDSILKTSDGGFIVIGWTYSFGAGGEDSLIIKLDSNGNLSWAKTYGGSSDEECWESISQTSDGGFVVAGYTDSFGAGGEDSLIIKLNSSGSVTWAKTFGGSGNDFATSIYQISDGGYIVAGQTFSFGAEGVDFLVLKLDSSGNIPGSSCDFLKDITSNLIVNSVTPIFSSPNPTVTTPTLSVSSPTLSVSSPNLSTSTICESAPAQTPVLLVHGFQIKTPFHPEDGWKEMASVLSGQKTFTPEKIYYNYGSSQYYLWWVPATTAEYHNVYISDYTGHPEAMTVGSISNYALGLAIEIDYIKKLEGCSKIDIVAHSMGGLVARRYIESEDFGFGPTYKNDVANLIMIGTPNYGVIEGILASALSKIANYECGKEMEPTSSFLKTLNGGITGRSKSVNYYTLAGNGVAVCYSQACLLSSSKSRTDGLVWVPSVGLPEAVKNYTVEYADHSGLILDENVANAVKDILAGNPPIDNVIKTKAFAVYTELHYQIHIQLFQVLCPVNVTIKDQYGRMINSQGVNQITDASVQVIGDEKLFCLPSNLSYTIELYAYSQGSFTLEALYLNDSGIIPATVFENVPINSNTKVVSSTIQPESVDFVLNVDSDGNGTFDYQKTPDLSGEVSTGSSLKTFTITALVADIGGSITPSGTISIDYGRDQTFTIAPNTGYHVKEVKVDGSSVGAVSSYTFKNITVNHTMEAAFEINSFTITASASEGGSISPAGIVTVNYGESKSFTITSTTGYHIKDVLVDGSSIGAVISYTFTNVNANHMISAMFEGTEATKTVIILQIGNQYMSINGTSQEIDPGRGTKPIIKNSRTLVPIRAIVEALSGSVEWNDKDKSVTIRLGSTLIKLQIGNAMAYVNGSLVQIDSGNPKVVPEIINNRTMLPLRFVTENLGAKVEWNGTTQTITITYSGS
jgi:triacylglycerol esterase/lipase EstA (alpha/beta hydrolase family)